MWNAALVSPSWILLYRARRTHNEPNWDIYAMAFMFKCEMAEVDHNKQMGSHVHVLLLKFMLSWRLIKIWFSLAPHIWITRFHTLLQYQELWFKAVSQMYDVVCAMLLFLNSAVVLDIYNNLINKFIFWDVMSSSFFHITQSCKCSRWLFHPNHSASLVAAVPLIQYAYELDLHV
jgi:hypothetical protein